MRTIIFTATVSPFLRLAVVSALSIGLASCVGRAPDPSESTAAPTAAATAAVQASQSVRTHGPAARFLNAVDTIDLRADQVRKVAAIRATLAEQTTAGRAARSALAAEIAQQVRTGVLDDTRTQPLRDQIKTAMTATRPAVQQAIQQLHDLLDASQRQALVDALPSHADHADHADHGARRAQMKARMDKIAAELSLTEEQRTTIHDQMRAAFAGHEHKDGMRGNHEQWKGRGDALKAAFVSETFDATALGAGDHAGRMAHRFGKMRRAFLAAAVPVLTPAQRNILASKIQNRMQANAPADVENVEVVDAVEE
jgi:Spy/CpxP family protein refolding chaperone